MDLKELYVCLKHILDIIDEDRYYGRLYSSGCDFGGRKNAG